MYKGKEGIVPCFWKIKGIQMECYIPGSGKSTWIESNPKASVHSADTFFMKEGVYQFNPAFLADAHNACLRGFMRDCIGGQLLVVVDNTNTTIEEIAPYYAIAEAEGYNVSLFTFMVEPEIAAKRNTHGVPLHAIRAMHERIMNRKIPSFWRLNQNVIGADK
jgi:predicted kinase